MTIPFLVGYKGGDALNVCFNTVAVLFLCEIDNIVYAVGVGERTKSRYEELGRVELEDVEAATLARSKTAHSFFVMVMPILGVLTQSTGSDFVSMFLCRFAFFLGSVAEVYVPGETKLGKFIKQVLGAFAAFVLGFIAMIGLALASGGKVPGFF